MRPEDLTSEERIHVQDVLMKGYLARKFPKGTRRATDRAPLEPTVTEECHRLASYGQTQRQIAKEVGVSQTSVHRHIRYFNLEGRRVA